jgi:surfactin synthase thioesterase subunit
MPASEISTVAAQPHHTGSHQWQCAAAAVCVRAFSPCGRGLLSTVPCYVCLRAQDVAQQLLPLVAPALLSAGGVYGIVGHSLGCWTAYELLLALRTAGAASRVCGPRVQADQHDT